MTVIKESVTRVLIILDVNNFKDQSYALIYQTA